MNLKNSLTSYIIMFSDWQVSLHVFRALMHSNKHYLSLLDGGKISKLYFLVISLFVSIVRLPFILWLPVTGRIKLKTWGLECLEKWSMEWLQLSPNGKKGSFSILISSVFKKKIYFRSTERNDALVFSYTEINRRVNRIQPCLTLVPIKAKHDENWKN